MSASSSPSLHLEPSVDAEEGHEDDVSGRVDSAPWLSELSRPDPVGSVGTSGSPLYQQLGKENKLEGIEVEEEDDDRYERASLVPSSDDDAEEAKAGTTYRKAHGRSRRGRHAPLRATPGRKSRWKRHSPHGDCRRRIGALRPLLCLGEVSMGLAVFLFVAFVVVVIPEYGRSSAVSEFPALRAPDAEVCQNWTIPNLDLYLDRYRTGAVSASCLDDDGDCHCTNPVIGSMPQDPGWWNMSWQDSNEKNQERVREALDQHRVLDVVLLGDSITEHWHGTDLGEPAEKFQDNVKVYDELFNSPDSPIQGLALGNGGDRTTQLLYRLEQGEIEELDAPVFWILIGTNDVLGASCATDDIVAGILASVRVLRQQKPSSLIVLQALLPVSGNEAHDPLRWRAYSEINQRLSCFAEQAPLVEFVNMTQSFLTEDDKVDISILVDGVHPGELGSSIFGGEIVRVVRRLLNLR